MTKRSKIKALFSALMVLTIALTAIAIPGCQTKGEIKIGAVLPLTGDAGVWGQDTKTGIDLAVDLINEAGGINGRQVRVVYEDSKADPQTGVSAFRKLITVDKVQYVIDNSISSVTLAMAPIAEENKVVLLATGATAPSISDAGDFIFRIWNSDAIEGQILASYVFDSLETKRVAILYINNDYGLGLRDVFTDAFKGEVVAQETYDQGTNDFRTQLAKILKESPEAIYLVGYPQECSSILRQAKELGFNGIWLGTVVMLDATVIKAVQQTGFEMYNPVPVFPEDVEEHVVAFLEAFQEKYGKEAPILSKVGYDAVYLFKIAAELEGLKGSQIQKGLIQIENYPGISGVIEFDENGDVHKPMAVHHIK